MDLWPYVNGKAIVSGVRLKELEASEMLDVLHYFFVESMDASTAEQQEARDNTNIQVYRELYGREYKYAAKKSSQRSNVLPPEYMDYAGGVDAQAEDIRPFDPKIDRPKPYIPPTPMNPDSARPFGNILDGPLG